MSAEARVVELRARIELALRTQTVLLAVGESDAVLEATRRPLLSLLRAAPMRVADLGACRLDTGPTQWVVLTRSTPADAYVLTASLEGPLSGAAFARLLNAERELLRQLAGPVVLLVPPGMEKLLRQNAPDFFTWVAQSYVLPGPEELTAIAVRLGAAEPLSRTAAKKVEEPVRFLHLSDVHLRPQRVKRYDQDRVLRGLIEFLEHDRGSFPLDLIFFTGDFAHGGRADEYALVAELIGRLLEVTGVPAERLFPVPGNHDVDREVGRWLLRTLARDEEAVAFFEEEASRRFHLAKFEGYRRCFGELLGAGRPLGLGVGEGAVEIVEVRGAKIAVASFNSAWFAQGDDDHGKLWLGEPNVDRAALRIGDERADFAVALMHHPTGDLHEIERDGIEFRFERAFDLVLRGHLHKDRARSIASARGGYVEVAGPAAYQGSSWPNGCFLGEIRPKGRSVWLRPLGYAAGAAPWVLDTKVFPDDAEQGYCHTFAVSEKRRMRGAVARELTQAAARSLKALSPSMQRDMAKQLGIPVQESRSSGELASMLAKVARTMADDPGGSWMSAEVGQALARAVIKQRKADTATGLSRADPGFLEVALRETGAAWRESLHDLPRAPEMLAGAAFIIVFSMLEAMLEAPVVLGKLGKVGPDILVGAPGEAAERRAIVDVKVVPTRELPTRIQIVNDALSQLDRELTASGVGRGALVLVDTISTGSTAAQLERAKTPAGREVLLLSL